MYIIVNKRNKEQGNFYIMRDCTNYFTYNKNEAETFTTKEKALDHIKTHLNNDKDFSVIKK